MILRCKKTYYTPRYMGDGSSKKPRIKEGEYYEVLQQHIRPDGGKYWLFLIPDDINPKGSGWFDPDEYFESLDEARNRILSEIGI